MRTALIFLSILIALLSGAGMVYVGVQSLTAQEDRDDLADEMAELGLETDEAAVETPPAPTPASAYGFLAGALDALLGIGLMLGGRRVIAAALMMLGGASSIAIAVATGATAGAAFLGIVCAGLLMLAGLVALAARPTSA
ncbi:MAG: hypothetical protein H6744_18520 [Deltaproteobacteria bacterium]|nr:hypothetical protein [Deltaproteobacteria bacterium]MCB9788676.1 hypothetical protein [Deltaproteobacteria bacterium]